MSSSTNNKELKSEDLVDSHDVVMTPLLSVKYIVSTIALIFSIVIITALIVDGNTKLANDTHPVVAFIALWVALIWLTMVEGSQASLVGLPPVDRSLYADSHIITHLITSEAHKGDNLDRYLMGRQFMVLLVVFVVNLSGGPLGGASVFGFPDVFQNIFLSSGLAMILLTCMVGQLAAQVNASHCMLDYINNYFALFTIQTAYLIEFSGIMHASYVIQLIVGMLAGKPIISKEEPRTFGQSVFFWGRCLMSIAILIGAFVVTFAALFEKKTTMWDGVPEWLSIVLFFSLMSVVGMLEGMQIAFFAVAHLPVEERGTSKFAKMTCNLLFKGNGYNLPGFMVGRQLCVVSCFFIIARVTTLNVEIIPSGENNILGVSNGLQEFFNTGLHAAVLTTIVASITWQLVASAFPIAFLSTPITYILLVICLALEATGICAGAWVLAKIHKSISGFQYDEVYVGTPEQRAENDHVDKEGNIHEATGHLGGSAFPAGTFPVGSHQLSPAASRDEHDV